MTPAAHYNVIETLEAAESEFRSSTSIRRLEIDVLIRQYDDGIVLAR